MSYRWSSLWGKDMNEAERKALVSALPILEKLNAVLDKKRKALLSEQMSKEVYDNPNFAYKQADYIASIRTLNEIQNIITPSVNKD
jgi:flagellin-specific chaperone FliS